MKRRILFYTLVIFAVLTVISALTACNTAENDNAFNNVGRNGLHGYENNPESHPYGGQYFGDGLTTERNEEDTISSDKTDIPSDQYPETKAIQVQEAKYKFVVDEEGIQNWQQKHGGKTPQAGQPGRKEHARQPSNQQQEQQEQQEQQAQPEPTQQPEQGGDEEQANEQQAPQEEQQESDQGGEADNGGINDAERRVIELTNVERRNNGLSELEADTELSNVARKKSTDMQENNYFSHTSPTYGSPFDMIRDSGVSYSTAGENIAQGQQSPEQVVESWMNSEGHRQNILSEDFTHIGVGYDETGHHWTQMFIGR